MARVLVVDADQDLAQELETRLLAAGHTSTRVGTGGQALVACANGSAPDLVLLELALPDMSGNEVCRQLRKNPHTAEIAIIMASARSDEIDRVVGFEVGVDDFVAKPFSTRELLLRVRAILRRTLPKPAKSASVSSAVDEQVVFGRLRVDSDAHQAWVDDEEVVLTALEFKLLKLLLDRRGRVQSRDRLLSDVWSIESERVTTRTVDTHVKRLRQKLGGASGYIETLRGVGYRCSARP